MSLVNDMLICVLAYISDLFSIYDFLFPVDCYFFFLFREDLSIFPFRYVFSLIQSHSNVQLFATPWTAACQASLSITNSWSLLKLMSIESVISSNHLILCRHLLLLHSIFPSIRVFSNESVLCIRWPKYWSFGYV